MSLVILIACAFAAVSCGGDDDGPGPSGSTPFEQIINDNVAVFGFTQHSFTAPRSGDLTVTLTWSNGAIDLDLYLTSSTCNNYPPGNCTILEESAAATGTSETVARDINNGNQVKFWVDNFSETLATAYQLRIRID